MNHLVDLAILGSSIAMVASAVYLRIRVERRERRLATLMRHFDLIRERPGVLTVATWCTRCGASYAVLAEHFERDCHCTDFGDGTGAFPLCTHCWEVLTPEERLPHYRYCATSDADWEQRVKPAVLADGVAS